MNERTMLERAARAAGYGAVRPTTFDPNIFMAMGDGEWKPWNPHSEDGDAFRLAVKLGLFEGSDLFRCVAIERFAGQEHDDCRAWRRAIVRAAASSLDEGER